MLNNTGRGFASHSPCCTSHPPCVCQVLHPPPPPPRLGLLNNHPGRAKPGAGTVPALGRWPARASDSKLNSRHERASSHGVKIGRRGAWPSHPSGPACGGPGQRCFGRASQRGVNRLPADTAWLGCGNAAGTAGMCFSLHRGEPSTQTQQHPEVRPSPGRHRGQGASPIAWTEGAHEGRLLPPPRTPNEPRNEPSFPESPNTPLRSGSGQAPASLEPSQPAPLAHQQLMGLVGIIPLFPTPLSRGG